MRTLVFLLEEPSMKALLEGLLPRVLPPDTTFICVPHEGKSDLETSIPRKLRAWRAPDTCFIVVRDQDAGDCRVVKERLVELCHQGHRPETLVRVVCRELESWVLGDFAALDAALGTSLVGRRVPRKFKDPDRLHHPGRELTDLVPGYQKIAGARAMGHHLDATRSRSHSFRVFVDGVLRVAAEGCQP